MVLRKAGFFVQFNSGGKYEAKYFAFSKYGGEDPARTTAEAWQEKKSLKRGETKNRVRKHPVYSRCIIMCLQNGTETMVSEDDLDRLSLYTWFSQRAKPSNPMYAFARVGRKVVKMHRFIMQPQPHEQIDHINGDGVDNRPVNLRTATSITQNNNRRMLRNNTSGLNGIQWQAGKAWYVRWREGGRRRSKCFNVGFPVDKVKKGVQKRAAKKYRDMVYRRIGNTNGIRPSKH